MIKDDLYWKLHKEEYERLFDELDKEIKQDVLDDPMSESAHHLNETVNKAIETRLKYL